jgi:erythromycin esterase-like protein
MPANRGFADEAQPSLETRLVLGALAGMVGTAAMTVAMRALHRSLPPQHRYPLPPREIVQEVLPEPAEHRIAEDHRQSLTMAAHFGYGAATAALYAAARPPPSAGVGALYGVLVWGASYLGWLPGAHILKPATQHPGRRNALMIVCHLVSDDPLALAVRRSARPLAGTARDYDPLMELVGDARLVLLGEASHGTHEFYRERAEITKRLIEEKGFAAVAVEADWPDAYRVNRYVQGANDDFDAIEALADFRRFPTWMWRNTEVVEFVEWLRAHNDALPQDAAKVGFYGLDLYSLRASMKAVLQFLEKVDPEAARRARERYACFDQFGEDTQVYGFVAGTGITKSCEEEVVSQLVELQRRAAEYARRDSRIAEDEVFYAEQNARLVKNAEAYYRSMFLEEVSSWNLRDRHMVETLEALLAHLERRRGRARIAVWAHNSHLGDARATEMSRRGELNVGQLVREKYGQGAVGIGFTTHHGTVTAASEWDAPAERKRVRPALAGSYEALFHAARPGRFLLTWRDGHPATEGLRESRLERAIGVIYRPETERMSHYFGARLPDQFDAVLHFDETRAVEPLEVTAEWEAGEPPETFPFGV